MANGVVLYLLGYNCNLYTGIVDQLSVTPPPVKLLLKKIVTSLQCNNVMKRFPTTDAILSGQVRASRQCVKAASPNFGQLQDIVQGSLQALLYS